MPKFTAVEALVQANERIPPPADAIAALLDHLKADGQYQGRRRDRSGPVVGLKGREEIEGSRCGFHVAPHFAGRIAAPVVLLGSMAQRCDDARLRLPSKLLLTSAFFSPHVEVLEFFGAQPDAAENALAEKEHCDTGRHCHDCWPISLHAESSQSQANRRVTLDEPLPDVPGAKALHYDASQHSVRT